MSNSSHVPEVTSQMLIDGGLNAFAFELVAECFTRKDDFAKWTGPMTFIFKGIQFTLQKPQPGTPAATPKEVLDGKGAA